MITFDSIKNIVNSNVQNHYKRYLNSMNKMDSNIDPEMFADIVKLLFSYKRQRKETDTFSTYNMHYNFLSKIGLKGDELFNLYKIYIRGSFSNNYRNTIIYNASKNKDKRKVETEKDFDEEYKIFCFLFSMDELYNVSRVVPGIVLVLFFFYLLFKNDDFLVEKIKIPILNILRFLSFAPGTEIRLYHTDNSLVLNCNAFFHSAIIMCFYRHGIRGYKAIIHLLSKYLSKNLYSILLKILKKTKKSLIHDKTKGYTLKRFDEFLKNKDIYNEKGNGKYRCESILFS